MCVDSRLASQMRPSRNNLFHLYLWVINKPVQRINYQIVMVSTSLLLAIERDGGESHIINVLWGVGFYSVASAAIRVLFVGVQAQAKAPIRCSLYASTTDIRSFYNMIT